MTRFKPWVGENYRGGFAGKRVLVLGESHYFADVKDARENVTAEIIADLYDPDSPHEPYKNTYTKFVKAMTGKSELTAEDKRSFWNSVAFYNFVQFPISGARIAPSASEFADSAQPFFQVLEQLKPEIVIVWGSRLYNNLPHGGSQGDSVQAPDGQWIEIWNYFLNDGGKVLILPVTHPSAAFTPEYWNKVISLIL